MSGKSRNYCFTWNNYTESDYEGLKTKLSEKDVNYWVIGKEIGDSGTPHLQGYVMFANPRATGGLKKKYGAKIHWEYRMGTHEQARDYCKKGEQPKDEWKQMGSIGPNWSKNAIYEEWGKEPEQGKRNDLNELKNRILSGATTVDEIVVDDPMKFHQYGRTLNKIEDLALRKKFRTAMTQGFWYWGETGVGKSHIAFTGYNPEVDYLYPNDNGWWDGYTGQKRVIINDFRGEIPYNMLLQLIDKWPMVVRRRGREPVPFVSEQVIITSSLPPQEVYWRRDEQDSIAQLLRRVSVFKLNYEWNGTEVVEGNTRLQPPTSVEPIDRTKMNNESIIQLMTNEIKGLKC